MVLQKITSNKKPKSKQNKKILKRGNTKRKNKKQYPETQQKRNQIMIGSSGRNLFCVHSFNYVYNVM